MEAPSPKASMDLLSRADLLEPALLRAAATLGVADVLAEEPANAVTVAARVGADASVMTELLQELAARELLARDGDTYALTDAMDPLRTDHPMSVRELLRNDSMLGMSGLSILRLDHTVHTGEPASLASGTSYWDEVNREPQYLAEWRRQVETADASEAPLSWGAQQIVRGYDWSDVEHVVDVGGHIGSVLLSLLRAQSHLRGTMVDIGHPATVASERFARSDVAERATVVDSSFFDPLPAGGDVYVLSAILADWTDDDAERILRRCAEAARPGGKVLLAEVAMPMDTSATRLRMRSMMPAPDRSTTSLISLAERAGLRLSWQADGDDGRSLLELIPV